MGKIEDSTLDPLTADELAALGQPTATGISQAIGMLEAEGRPPDLRNIAQRFSMTPDALAASPAWQRALKAGDVEP